MPLINLIQEQRLAVKRDERNARTFFMAFLGVGALSAIAFLGLLLETERMASEEGKLRSQIQRIKPMLEKIETNKSQYGELTPRIKTLEDAQLMTARWDRMLEKLSRQTPAHTWMTTVRSTAVDPEKPIAINFGGLATAQEHVGELMMRLQNFEDLEDVQLKFTQEKLTGQTKGIEFSIDANVVGSAEKRAVVKEEGKS